MTIRLDDKVIVMTGAGRGIGAAVARLAASLGARIVVNDLDAAEAQATVDAIARNGGAAISHPADITDWTAARGLIDRAVSEWGRLDGLFNNAGYFRMDRAEDMQEAQLRSHLEVNVVGAFACTVPAIERMLSRGAGAILNVTSGAQMGMAGMSAYGASKGAIASATYAWSAELRDRGIRVNALSPMAATRMVAETERFYKRRQSAPVPAEANAPVACFLLSDAACNVHGQVVRSEGRKLALTTHPGVALPVLEGDWDIDSIAKAFADDLSQRQFPTGTVGMQVELGQNASSVWQDMKDR